ncbi:MAG: hypothetical protein K0Q49_502, partial [Haloplasmataceae bacterium]|nr:hypothetical protein [Haloplasmataceae bacterium]
MKKANYILLTMFLIITLVACKTTDKPLITTNGTTVSST